MSSRNRYSGDYELVWWIRSEAPAKLASDYAGLAKPLGLNEERELNVTVQAVRAELANREHWLLVFDNANNPDEVRDYLPQAGQGHVLITSRHSDWMEVAEPLAITTWQRDESVAFLLKRTGQAVDAVSGKSPLLAKDARNGAPHVVDGAADALAEALGDLPLALEQAAANITASGGSLADYLKTLREHTREVLRRGKAPAGYHATVATTWEISFVDVEKESEAAGQLMNLCAFLAPDDIGRQMLRGGVELLPEPLAAAVTDDLQWDAAVAALRRYSLVEVQGGAISVHRLVQAVVRDRLDEAGRKRWAEAAVKLVRSAFPYRTKDIDTWAASSRLLSHAMASAEHSEGLRVGLEASATLLNDVGLYLGGRAELLAARSVLGRALRIAEIVYGQDSAGVAAVASNLGNVLREGGDLAGPQVHLERALRIEEAELGPEHRNLAISLSILGLLLRSLGDLAGARAHLERAVRIGEATLGSDHPDVAVWIANLGGVLRGLGDLAGAQACFQRGLRIDEAVYGPDHPDVAALVNNLGSVLRELGDLAGARANFERALRIVEAAYGPDHPSVATVVNNLGNVLEDSDDLAGARACYERALKIGEAALGRHPDVAVWACNLGGVLKALGDLAGARACFERALKMFEQTLGKGHPSTQRARRSLEGLG